MKNLFFVIVLFFNICIVQSQEYLKDIPSHDCTSLLTDDSLFYCCNIVDGVSIITRNDEPDEIFKEGDTSFRSYLIIGKGMVMIDSLFFANYNEYAMDITEIEYYSMCDNGEEYLMIHCINGKVFGTFVQPMYIILKKKKDLYHIQSTYLIEDLEDGSMDIPNSVMVNYSNGVLQLTGTNVKRIKFYKQLTK